MKALHLALVSTLAIGGVSFITGCDKTTEEKTVTKTTDGGTVKDTHKETVSSDGKTVKTTDEKTAEPARPVTETKETTTVSPDGKTTKKTEVKTEKP